MSQGKHVSNFPIGAMGILHMSTYMGCVPVDRGRRYRDRATPDIDTASLQTTSKRESPIGAMDLSRHVHSVVDRSVRSCASVS